MNSNLKSKKLRIQIQTVRVLDSDETRRAAGGLSLALCNLTLHACNGGSVQVCPTDNSGGCGMTGV